MGIVMEDLSSFKIDCAKILKNSKWKKKSEEGEIDKIYNNKRFLFIILFSFRDTPTQRSISEEEREERRNVSK